MSEIEKEIVDSAEVKESKNFIEQIIEKDLAEGVYDTVHTRFPPEPNGYLHIGHAKSILLNYGLSQKYNGKFNLRFDDTNPTKEKAEFVESIKADVKWLGADWEDRLFFASNYFDQMYEAAVKLIKKGKAYVSDLSAEQIREYRGSLTEPGKEDPGSTRSVEENLLPELDLLPDQKTYYLLKMPSDHCRSDHPVRPSLLPERHFPPEMHCHPLRHSECRMPAVRKLP